MTSKITSQVMQLQLVWPIEENLSVTVQNAYNSVLESLLKCYRIKLIHAFKLLQQISKNESTILDM